MQSLLYILIVTVIIFCIIISFSNNKELFKNIFCPYIAFGIKKECDKCKEIASEFSDPCKGKLFYRKVCNAPGKGPCWNGSDLLIC